MLLSTPVLHFGFFRQFLSEFHEIFGGQYFGHLSQNFLMIGNLLAKKRVGSKKSTKKMLIVCHFIKKKIFVHLFLFNPIEIF